MRNEIPLSDVACESLDVRDDLSIGGTLTVAGFPVVAFPALAPGSIVFIDAGGMPAADPNLQWDDVANSIVVGGGVAVASHCVTLRNSVAANAQLALQSLDANGLSGLDCYDELGVIKAGFGYDNASNQNYIELSGADLNIHDDVTSPTGTGDIFRFTPSGALEWTRTNGAANAAASKARLAQFNSGFNGKLQLSMGSSPAGAGYFDVATYAAALSTGVIPFANANNQLAQNLAAGPVWDASTGRMGIGTGISAGIPASALDIRKAESGAGILNLINTAADGYTDITFNKSDTTLQGAVGYGNATVGITHFRGLNFLFSTGPDYGFGNGTRNNLLVGMTAGSAFWQMSQGNGALGTLSAANTCKFVYDEVANQVKVSKNGGAFAVLI